MNLSDTRPCCVVVTHPIAWAGPWAQYPAKPLALSAFVWTSSTFAISQKDPKMCFCCEYGYNPNKVKRLRLRTHKPLNIEPQCLCLNPDLGFKQWTIPSEYRIAKPTNKNSPTPKPKTQTVVSLHRTLCNNVYVYISDWNIRRCLPQPLAWNPNPKHEPPC